MNCCDYQCEQGRDCPARNDTTRVYPRTLEEAFPHAPDPVYDDIMAYYGYTLLSYVLVFFFGFVASLILDKFS
jgi:hypothetical protein